MPAWGCLVGQRTDQQIFNISAVFRLHEPINFARVINVRFSRITGIINRKRHDDHVTPSGLDPHIHSIAIIMPMTSRPPFRFLKFRFVSKC